MKFAISGKKGEKLFDFLRRVEHEFGDIVSVD